MSETGVTTFDQPDDTSVRIRRTVAAPRTLVFDVHTSPEHLPHWMLGPPGWTMPVCEIDLRPGGAYRYVWQGEGGADLVISGTFEEVDRPALLKTTERWGGGDWPETRNTLTFTERDLQTTITTLVVYPSTSARDQAVQTGMLDGLDAGFGNLDRYLASIPQTPRMRLELVPVPVADIDAAIAFYAGGLGFHLDHDVQPGNGSRIVQLTPEGSACSILLSKDLPGMDLPAGTLRGLHVVVEDLAATRELLHERGVKTGDVMDMGGILYSELADPDGNTWLLQQVR